jgi:hypothetical protein
MIIDWRKYDANFVRTQTVDGQRLVLIFANDFKNKFNREICVTCESNFKADFEKYINNMETKKSEYKLKAKYDGISLGFGKKGRLSNDNMNDNDARYLIKNHPRGEELFESLPKKEEPKIKETNKKNGED